MFELLLLTHILNLLPTASNAFIPLLAKHSRLSTHKFLVLLNLNVEFGRFIFLLYVDQ